MLLAARPTIVGIKKKVLRAQRLWNHEEKGVQEGMQRKTCQYCLVFPKAPKGFSKQP